ncbi:hypothetical protein QTP70_024744, partial [Hemibagrus guttatus]
MGRGSPIPPMLRRKIVEQYQKGVSQRKIANSLKLSSSTVHDIIQRFRESGTISVRKGQGRKTILDARDLRALRRHCITYRNATVMEITTWAQEYFQKTLSVNTIHRAIRRCRLKLYRSKKKPYLNMIQKRRHFLWAKAHLKWTVAKWKTVLWSDESKFEVLFGKLGRHVIRTKEDKDNPSCYQRSVQKPASLMVWGCMSAYVMGSLHIWKGTINAERNYNINVSTYQFFVFFLMFQYTRQHLDKPHSFWSRVIWSDETKIELYSHNHKRYVWRGVNKTYGEKYTIPTVKHVRLVQEATCCPLEGALCRRLPGWPLGVAQEQRGCQVGLQGAQGQRPPCRPHFSWSTIPPLVAGRGFLCLACLARGIPDTEDLGLIIAQKQHGLKCHDPIPSRHDPIASSHDPITSRHDPIPSSHDPIPSSHDPIPSHHDPIPSRHNPIPSRHDLQPL